MNIAPLPIKTPLLVSGQSTGALALAPALALTFTVALTLHKDTEGYIRPRLRSAPGRIQVTPDR